VPALQTPRPIISSEVHGDITARVVASLARAPCGMTVRSPAACAGGSPGIGGQHGGGKQGPGRLAVAPMSSVAPRRLTMYEQLPPRRQRRCSEVLLTSRIVDDRKGVKDEQYAGDRFSREVAAGS
jgi:hypothetical protein